MTLSELQPNFAYNFTLLPTQSSFVLHTSSIVHRNISHREWWSKQQKSKTSSQANKLQVQRQSSGGFLTFWAKFAKQANCDRRNGKILTFPSRQSSKKRDSTKRPSTTSCDRAKSTKREYTQATREANKNNDTPTT